MYLGDCIIIPNIVISLLDWNRKLATQQIMNDGVDIGNVDFSIIIHIATVTSVIVGKTSQHIVNQAVNVCDVDFPIAVHITCLQGKQIGCRRLLVFINGESQPWQIKGDDIVVAAAIELVGVVVITFLGSIGVADSHFLSVGCGAVAVAGVECVPVAVKSVGKHKPHCSADVYSIGVDAISLIKHFNTIVGIPVPKGVVAHYIDGSPCRQKSQHDQ